MKVKICGMRMAENIQDIVRLEPDFVGFILYPPSPRYVKESDLDALVGLIPESIKTVGVFVNESPAHVINVCTKHRLDFAQLHGSESVEDCQVIRKAGISIIKAFSVENSIDFDNCEPYQAHVDFFLFDTKSKAFGGSGKKFDWQLLSEYPLQKPFLLSGGIGEQDIEAIAAIALPMLHGVDANSLLEVEPGLKNIDLASKLINQITSS